MFLLLLLTGCAPEADSGIAVDTGPEEFVPVVHTGICTAGSGSTPDEGETEEPIPDIPHTHIDAVVCNQNAPPSCKDVPWKIEDGIIILTPCPSGATYTVTQSR